MNIQYIQKTTAMIVQEILSHQSKTQQDLDRILARCCELVLDGHATDPDHWGMVGACVVLPNGEEVYGVNHVDSEGLHIHAERAALNACETADSRCMIVTTLSPCNRPMDERHGGSCTDLIATYDIGLENIYCGYKDPTQDEDGIEETNNPKLRELCKRFADTFLLKEPLDESVQDEKFLQQIGNAVAAWAERYKTKNKEKLYAGSAVEPGTIGKITGIKGKTKAEKHLLNLGILFFILPKMGGSPTPLGAYRPARGEWGGDIGADLRYLIPDATLNKTKSGQQFIKTMSTHETDLGSTVAHELRHALDDYLSKGKYDSSAHKFDYHDQTLEINAFFTQALKSLQEMINDGIIDQSNLQWAIRRVFYNNELIINLIDKKDPRVKRLFSRAYTYLQNTLP